MRSNNAPVFIGACHDGERLDIDGNNVWEYDWKDLGENVEVRDPNHNQIHIFSMYLISKSGIEIRFIAGEFSNGVWGFFKP